MGLNLELAPIVDIVERTSDEVDLFITGHTHQAYNCVIDGRPVTSSASFGRVVFRGDRQGREFVAFWLDGEGRVAASITSSVVR